MGQSLAPPSRSLLPRRREAGFVVSPGNTLPGFACRVDLSRRSIAKTEALGEDGFPPFTLFSPSRLSRSVGVLLGVRRLPFNSKFIRLRRIFGGSRLLLIFILTPIYTDFSTQNSCFITGTAVTYLSHKSKEYCK
jgi:hypothetical protein